MRYVFSKIDLLWKGALVLAVAMIFFDNTTVAQGCSDAGFCTMSTFKPHTSDSVKQLKNRFKMAGFYGGADHSITVSGAYLEYGRQFGKVALDARITAIAQSGNQINQLGLSDVFVSATYQPVKNWGVTAGLKLPLADGNVKKDGLPLPMDYQSSLGTLDLVLGLSFKIKELQLVAAMQQPLTQNENQFLSANQPAASALKRFQSTNQYQRSGDVLLRVSYPVLKKGKFTLTPSLLPIYHLANDEYVDETKTKKAITGSEGLTLNGNLYLNCQLSERAALELNAGSPFIARDVRPDGLTRSYIVNLEYSMRF